MRAITRLIGYHICVRAWLALGGIDAGQLGMWFLAQAGGFAYAHEYPAEDEPEGEAPF